MKQKQVLKNAIWIILCKIAQSVIQLIVGMLSARYLGPANYGLISYAASIVTFVTPIMKLGFDSTLVRELINDPEGEGEIMGTSIFMNVLSALVCIMGIAVFVTVSGAGEGVKILVCVLYSISLFFAALEMIQYWYQYKLLSKYSSIVMLISYVVVSAYKIFLLVSAKSVYWFALVNSLDFGIIGIALIVIYLRKGGGRLRVSLKRAKALFSNSKYYIFASLMVVVYHNTDHIMLTTMIGETENGFYSAAITCATIAQFVYTAIIDSFRPMILSAKKENESAYEKSMSGLYGIITYLTLAQSIVFTVFSGLIVFVLYGAEYEPAAAVLRVLVWYIVFSVMGTVRNVWILAEEKQKLLPVINTCGALMNILLNLVFIRWWGASGAAFASFLTQLFTNFILGFIIKPIRKSNLLMLKGLNPVFMVRQCVTVLRKIRRKKEEV